ncbi:protein odr-4 homolog [Episyrphus balteatus]|uniref:protein odr-4 homolog n=1 Tax=Episyrphus balteatus TaxID=286459 RepID=UPI002486BA8D|nr:protein odr-4 homolog [Episyrphus balteatus]
MPTIFFSKKSENYLKKAAEELKVAFGIIIGQKTSDDKYNIIHFAKLSEDEESISSSAPETIPSIENVDVQSLADQWISASKMTPGSFSVIGVFMSNGENDSNDEKQTKNIKKMLTELYKLTTNSNSTFEYAEHTKDLEILFLSYAASSSKANVKIFSNSSSGGNLMPADCKIVEKLPQWYLFESNYELEDVFPITDNREQVNIENQFNAVLQAVKSNIQNSKIFIQQQNVDDNSTLENYLKENNNKKNEVPVFNASILLTANVSNEFLIKIRPFNGTVRFSGIVSSRIWSQAKNTFKEIKESIRRDVLRSLAARIQIYCDGLTDIHSNTVGIVVNEPPRRIYFCNSESQGIQFSEYIFRGETPSVAVSQAKQILDMDINSDCIFDDLEGLPDDEVTSLIDEPIKAETSIKTNGGFEISRTMYMLGITVALLVLLLSVLLNYLFL